METNHKWVEKDIFRKMLLSAQEIISHLNEITPKTEESEQSLARANSLSKRLKSTIGIHKPVGETELLGKICVNNPNKLEAELQELKKLISKYNLSIKTI
tara:strand:- start:700 stop:999 length:300 start_codon:yes stop_codon:yes gene_type:complete